MEAKKKAILILDCSEEDLTIQMEKTLKTALEKNAHMNLPLVYRNSFCKERNQFVHEYPNGKKLLIQQNSKTSEEIVLREL
jgi:hypothetical protein